MHKLLFIVGKTDNVVYREAFPPRDPEAPPRVDPVPTSPPDGTTLRETTNPGTTQELAASILDDTATEEYLEDLLYFDNDVPDLTPEGPTVAFEEEMPSYSP